MVKKDPRSVLVSILSFAVAAVLLAFVAPPFYYFVIVNPSASFNWSVAALLLGFSFLLIVGGIVGYKRAPPAKEVSLKPGEKPSGLTASAVLIGFIGLFLLLVSLFAIFAAGNVPTYLQTTARTMGAIGIVAGLIFLGLAKYVYEVKNWARIVVTVLIVVVLFDAVVQFFSGNINFMILVYLAILYLLWLDPKTTAAFKQTEK